MTDKPKIIGATVYLRSQSGASILKEKNVALLNPDPYLPSQDTMNRAVSELQDLGFKIEAQGITLSISGPAELFEQKCGVEISFEEITLQETGFRPKTKFFIKSSEPVMKIPGLEDIVEGIVISTPGMPF